MKTQTRRAHLSIEERSFIMSERLRGSNENINGLIRQFLPKGMDLSQVSQRMLNRISLLLNIRPRAVLNFQNPLEVYSQMIEKIQNAQTLPTVALES